MIKANCRDRFTAADFEFVAHTLSQTERDSVSLVELLTDAEARDAILDHPRLVEAILATGATLRISPQFYFYVLIRHVLKRSGLNDRGVSDYVASLLETFSQTARMRSPADGRETTLQYISDMLVALQGASPVQSFLIRAHVGNYSLFLSGLFRSTVESRCQRGGPELAYYEGVGRTNFRVAASHHVARSCALTSIYETLSDSFREVRIALNELSDSLLHLDESASPNYALLG